MKTPNLAGILVVGFLIGGIISFLGAIIKFFNAGDIINLYDETKHDKDKASKVFGGNFIFIGMSEFVVSLISIFVDKIYYLYMMFSLVVILILGFIITFYQFFKKCKKI